MKYSLIFLFLFSVICLAAQDGTTSYTNEQLQTQALAGNSASAYELGNRYITGITGLEVDSTQASKWFLVASEKGNADAESAIGVLYGQGSGVEQNYTEAVNWLRKLLNKTIFEPLIVWQSLHHKGMD
jgi:TPR repeat protein